MPKRLDLRNTYLGKSQRYFVTDHVHTLCNLGRQKSFKPSSGRISFRTWIAVAGVGNVRLIAGL
jgi:hypothetical protein